MDFVKAPALRSRRIAHEGENGERGVKRLVGEWVIGDSLLAIRGVDGQRATWVHVQTANLGIVGRGKARAYKVFRLRS